MTLSRSVLVLLLLLLRPAAAEDALATVHLTPGWATFGQALAQGEARGGLRVGDIETQTDVKTRWGDGSIRFAVVTAHVEIEGEYAVAAGEAATGTFEPRRPNPVVALSPDGWNTTQWAWLPPDAEGSPWLDGPLVREARYEGAWASVPDPDTRPYPFLRVLFDVRSYRDGGMRVEVVVENTQNAYGASAARYSVSVCPDQRGGPCVQDFTRDAVTHAYLARWRKVFALDLQESDVTPDLDPFHRAGALPRFLPIVTNDVSAAEGADYDILGRGCLDPYMPNHGGRAELAPYPDWAARYLVHREPRRRRFVLALGDLAGSWPVHVREEDGRVLTIDAHPDFWLDPRGQSPYVPEPDRPHGDLGATGPLVPDNAHQPSLAYVPYLLTGDRYYADEMAFWADYVLLSTFQDGFYNPRGGGMREGPGSGTPHHPGSWGLLAPNETRGVAWGLRNLADAAAWLPDDEPLRAHFAEKVAHNLEWLDQLAGWGGPLGVSWHHTMDENGEVVTSLWAHNYLAWAIDHARRQGFEGGLAYRDQVVRFQVRLFVNDEGYAVDGAAPYRVPLGYRDDAGEVHWYTELRTLYRGPVQFEGYYGVDARLSALLGVESGVDGAREAYDYVHAIVAGRPYMYDVPDLALRAGWAIGE